MRPKLQQQSVVSRWSLRQAFLLQVALSRGSPIFLRGEAFFTPAGFFLKPFEALAEVPGLAVGVFLAPALAVFMGAAEFGAAIVLTFCLLGGQWDAVQDFFKMDNISMTALYLC